MNDSLHVRCFGVAAATLVDHPSTLWFRVAISRQASAKCVRHREESRLRHSGASSLSHLPSHLRNGAPRPMNANSLASRVSLSWWSSHDIGRAPSPNGLKKKMIQPKIATCISARGPSHSRRATFMLPGKSLKTEARIVWGTVRSAPPATVRDPHLLGFSDHFA